MTRQNTAYIHGSAARQMYAEPVRRREERPGIEVERRRQQRQKTKSKPKQRIDKVSVILTIFTFAAAMLIGIAYLNLQFQSTYLNKNVVNLQSEVVELEKENATASQVLEDSLNLSAIYEKATKELGMVAAKDNQVYTYESKKSTQVRQHGNIPTE